MVLEPPRPEVRDVVLPPLGRPAAPPDSVRGGGAPAIVAVPDEVPVIPAEEAVAAPVARVGQPDSAAGVGVGLGRDSLPTTPTPRLGDASLWVQPLGLADLPEDVRGAIVGDPWARARMQALFDSVQAEPGAERALPEWAVEIPGVGRVGIDSQYVHVGPFKIPAAVLALLPFPQGNIGEAERAAMLMEMRADIMQAAQRAATVEEFKERVKAIRERKQAERDFERAQKATRDTIKP